MGSIRLGTWNVKSLYMADKLNNVVKEMQIMRIWALVKFDGPTVKKFNTQAPPLCIIQEIPGNGQICDNIHPTF